MRFENPWWLVVLIPALAGVVLVARAGRRTVPRRQHRVAVAVRVVAVTALIAAAAGPILQLPGDDRTVLFLVDRSASIGPQARTSQETVIGEALRSARPGDRSAVMVFGADARVDSALATGRTEVQIRTVVDDSATDLGGALRAAAALLPTAGSRRIVVLSDMVETTGTARSVVSELAERSIAVDVVPVASIRPPDALVEAVRLPPVVRRGETAQATVVIDSALSGPATLYVQVDGESRTIPVILEPGRTTVPVPVDPGDEAFLEVRARLDAPGDLRPENDEAAAIARVLGPARVGIVEGIPGEGTLLAAALEAAGMQTELLGAIPPAEKMLAFDALVLVDVARPDTDAVAALAGFVEDLGRGMVVVGGEQAYGMGGYEETGLERLLPVTSNPDDLVRRKSVAEVLVIDTSGSMANCHCGDGNEFFEGGVNKTDISRVGAALAIDALADDDRVGVLAVSSGTDWVIPLGPKPDPTTAEEALGTLFPAGDTELARGLRAALEELRDAPESLRHIVLFTDGWDPNDANLVPLAREIADAGITLSVLGTGEGAGTTLRRMAEIGGGRYYPGEDLASVPEIFAEETLKVSRNLIAEGSFLPVLGAPSPATRDLTASPPLLGYVVTKAKGTASVALEIGPGDPLLASWQRGLGRVTAWTSDATGRWADAWVDWEGFSRFWGAVLAEVVPPGRDRAPEVFVDRGALRIRLDAAEEPLEAQATARVRRPDGELAVVPLRRVTSARWEGSTTLGGPGAYWVAVTVEGPDGSVATITGGTVSSYRQEFVFADPDPTLASELAGRTGGRVDPDPATLFEPAARLGTDDRPVAPWLAALALALFLTDVALRRLDFGAGDAEAWREGITSETRRERRRVAAAAEAPPETRPEVLSESETLRRLMRRKRR